MSQFCKLPKDIQELAGKTFGLFLRDPSHPSLDHHELEDVSKGRHAPHSWSVRVTIRYRAIYVVVDGVNVWYWIGTRSVFKTFTGSKN